MAPLKIAIIGAGPAGCLLARLLLQPTDSHQIEISVTIFEGEAALNVRSQGGTLDLHVETGQSALREAGLFEEFQKFARYDGEALKIADKNLLCYISQNGSKPGSKLATGRPEIDRPQLRQILYDALPSHTVQWGHKLVRVDDDNTLHFANGNVESGFDVVVGADGAWSKVRPRMTNVQPHYSGIGGHSFIISDAQQTHRELYELVNRGSVFSFSDGKSITAQYMSDGSLNVGTWMVRSQDWHQARGLDLHNVDAVKKAYAAEYADWHPTLRKFIEAADDDHVAPRDFYMLPVNHRWDHVPGVTLIGDAAHLATPFAGEGVNIALQDSQKLSQAIRRAKDKADLDVQLKAYEQDMFARATAMKDLTWKQLTNMHLVPNAPRANIAPYIYGAVGYGMNPVLKLLLLKPVVYTYFFFFKLLY